MNCDKLQLWVGLLAFAFFVAFVGCAAANEMYPGLYKWLVVVYSVFAALSIGFLGWAVVLDAKRER
jgi:hypothetical protein